jgi:hypothetical protein
MASLPTYQEALHLDEDEKNSYRELFSFNEKYSSQDYKTWGVIFNISSDLKNPKQINSAIKEYFELGKYFGFFFLACVSCINNLKKESGSVKSKGASQTPRKRRHSGTIFLLQCFVTYLFFLKIMAA